VAERSETKIKLILDAAIKVFAIKGYHYATVDDIAREAAIAKGSVHAYFENKLDVLLTIMLLFWQTVNKTTAERMALQDNPLDALKTIFESFQDMLLYDQQSVYWGRILQEGLPQLHSIKKETLRLKKIDIDQERNTLIDTIDAMIRQAQEQGLIKNNLKYQVIRQMLGGASQLLVYGLFMNFSRGQGIGYDESDVREAMTMLIDSFTS
jgi:TetR/AcrR family transcriptional regulator, fatty acid metabolism regulator protein